MMSARILITDDKQSIVEILETALGAEGYSTVSAATGAEALDKISGEKFDLILCDVRLPDMDGTEILKSVAGGKTGTAVIMITAYGSIENAISCMKMGACDYITKPFNLDEIKEVVKRGLERVRLERENVLLRAEIERKYDFSGIIARSKAMQEVLDRIKRVAPSNASVLITGETGVGKDLVAKAIHYNSTRVRGNFVALNCAAIPENLLESELFGHVKGAFTGAFSTKRGIFEDAGGGTLLLDEIAELHQMLQAKLLRALDEGSIRRVGDNRSIPFDTRLICSTNKDLAAEVRNNRFRLDLYHRIKVVEIHIPPLRDRREDIPILAEFYLRKLAAEHDRNGMKIAPDAMNLILHHSWVGNVRELINVLEQAILMSEGDTITAERLPSLIQSNAGGLSTAELVKESSLKKMLDRVEKDIIIHVLGEANGSRKGAAKRLGLSERALYYKLNEHDLK
jgi:two-component system, NtrC family, response regulator AtoC